MLGFSELVRQIAVIPVLLLEGYYYYYYNAFITRHTSGLKTCSEALTNIQYRIV